MDILPPQPDQTTPAEELPLQTPRPLSEIVLETSLVLLLCVLPLLFESTAFLLMTRQGPGPFVYQGLASMLRSITTIALVLYVISLRGTL